MVENVELTVEVFFELLESVGTVVKFEPDQVLN